MSKVPFNVDAYTARLIGRENVSKLDGAVIELIKNTYDADATMCILYYDDISDVLYLADNGTGMTFDVIQKHWMTIGHSSKKNSYTTDSGRIQTGAKGIGRFALDRIADQCIMLTGTRNSAKKILWNVDWSEFAGGTNITEITADITEVEDSFETFLSDCGSSAVKELIRNKWSDHGTVFKMINLREKWDKKLINSIKENLSSLIPYELGELYKIYCFDNEVTTKEAEVFSDIDAFSFDYKIEFSVESSKEQKEVSYKIWRDEFDFGINEDSVLRKVGLLEEKKHFHGEPVIRTELFTDIVANVSEEDVNSLGSFSGILYFSKIQTTKKDREKYYQKDISGRNDVRDTFGGIKIYRDSFRVRPYGDPKSSAFDWLQLARRKTASPAGVGDPKGVWRVSADQMLGSIFISRLNISLPDQSNREGIVETKEFRLLKELIEKMLERLEQDRQYICRKLNLLYENEHPTESIEKEIREKVEKKNTEKKVSQDNVPEVTKQEYVVDSTAALRVIEKKNEQIQELEDEIKMLRALATTGIVTNTYIHEFKTLSHKLNMKIVMAKEAIDQYHDMQEASDYINQANEVREAFNSWFQVTIEAVKNDKRKRRKVNIAKIISRLVDSWNQTLESKKIRIEYPSLKDDEIVIKCFPFEIETIINNLITNSVASFDSIKTEQRVILIKSYEDDEYVWIDYEDTGAGLIESYKKNPAKILEAFETSKRDVDGELVGTGMGMWIVNNTVLDYKGKIDLSKNLETKKGFYVTISLRK